MKRRLLNGLLIITSLLGYLEWGGNQHSFLFEVEATFFSKLLTDPISVLHPFTLLPLAGQIILLITLFQKTPNRLLTYIGMIGLGLLLGFMFVIALLSTNYKILLSTIPFLLTLLATIRAYKTQNNEHQGTDTSQ
jgi:hypothetical protein